MSASFKIPQSVLVVIHTVELDVLLIERAGQAGFWQSVTGSLDAENEAFRDAAIREVGEETGIIIATSPQAANEVDEAGLSDWQLTNVYDIYPIWRHRYAPGVTRNTEHVFGLQVPRGTPVTLAPREHVQYTWLPYRQAADQCFSASNAEAILHLPRYARRG